MPIKYQVEIRRVREVALLGTADLAFWAVRLKPEGVSPAEQGGRARLLLCAAELRFLGVRFRELSVSVFVRPAEGAACRDAAYLTHAFNSNRFFAFAERAFFATPYCHGDVRVDVAPPASFQVRKGCDIVLRAEMSAEASASGRAPSRSGDDGWEGPVFLPGREKLFFARLTGHTKIYPFAPGKDVVKLNPSRGAEIVQQLADSGFAGEEWLVREDATHAKSKTVKRAAAQALQTDAAR
jgi:hypothetical protein